MIILVWRNLCASLTISINTLNSKTFCGALRVTIDVNFLEPFLVQQQLTISRKLIYYKYNVIIQFSSFNFVRKKEIHNIIVKVCTINLWIYMISLQMLPNLLYILQFGQLISILFLGASTYDLGVQAAEIGAHCYHNGLVIQEAYLSYLYIYRFNLIVNAYNK